MKLSTTAFADGGVIPIEFAFGAIDPVAHLKLSRNRNPDFAWSELPAGTKSLALICHDPDVPSRTDDVNKEDRSVPASLARVDFFHWVLIDLPSNAAPIERGEFSDGVTARGKPGPASFNLGTEADWSEVRGRARSRRCWTAGVPGSGGW